ncbi:MAG: hypothetical protein Q8Q09_02395 [Deltaproteobacteria bacterium]|nr:hypothetical protein [Deltaproteobacteria bacterium]
MELPVEMLDWDAGRPVDARQDTRLRCGETLCEDSDPCTISQCVSGACVHSPVLTVCSCGPGCIEYARGAETERPFEPDTIPDGTRVTPEGGLVLERSLVDSDYLWVPNVAESTVSKWDARTQREIARYRVGLASGECRGQCCHTTGCNMPSRVVVDGSGDAYVANRGFSMQGTVSKIAAERTECVDRNGNGMIDTSTSADNVLPLGTDECVVWTVPVGPVDAVLRSLAIDRGSEDFPQGTVWVGACRATAGTRNAGLVQLDPRRGSVMRTVPFDACAYGSVVTPDGTLWQHTINTGITPVNPISGEVGAMVFLPDRLRGCVGNSYGITADRRGRIWLSGSACADVVGYDPAMRAWTRAVSPVQGRTINVGLGITTDSSGVVWSPINTTPPSLMRFHSDRFVANGPIPADAMEQITPRAALSVPFAPSAVGIDRAGMVWLASASLNTPLIRLDPVARTASLHDGPNRVYTYSDFTGGVRRLLLGGQPLVETVLAGCENPQWAEVQWTAEIPEDSRISVRLAFSQNGSSYATQDVLTLELPTAASPVDLTALLRARPSIRAGRYARMTLQMYASSELQVPTLHRVALAWRCPVGPG